MRTINEYLKLPYTKEIRNNEDGTVFAKVKELPGWMTEADTVEEALKMLDDAMKGWIIAANEDGDEIPLPESFRNNKEYSGKLIVRIPKSLHKHLAEDAVKEHISLNSYIISLLAKG